MAHWELDRYLYVEEADAERIRYLGSMEPFAIERLQPGLVMVYTRRRVTFFVRLRRWFAGLRANGEKNEQRPGTEERTPSGSSAAEV